MASLCETLHSDIYGKQHPIIASESLRKRYGDDELMFEFSRYVYSQRGLTSSREVFEAHAFSVSDAWMMSQIERLTSRQELAWHSRAWLQGKCYHIPMIDFLGRQEPDEIIHYMKAIGICHSCSFFLFDSGRSLHGYFDILIPVGEWLSFLGSLLLLNRSDSTIRQVTDSRWVGHSLEHGFSALRVSNNTNPRQCLPTLVSRYSL